MFHQYNIHHYALKLENGSKTDMDKLENNHETTNQSDIVSTSEFLDFLKLASRVHETIILKDVNAPALDYNALAKNELVNSLVNIKYGKSPKAIGEDSSSIEKNGKLCKTNCDESIAFH